MQAKIVLTTCGTKQEAEKIARALVETRLAACVNIVPGIESVYRWQGKVESETEWMLVIKTTAGRFEAVREAIREMHSYDLPECIMISIEGGSPEYLKWIEENSKS